MRILWLWRTDLRFRNRTQYQRPLSIARSTHQVTFVVRNRAVILEEVAQELTAIQCAPFELPGFFDHIWLFFYSFWAFWKRRKLIDAVYSPPDYSILWAAFLKKVFPRIIWVADMWDDPRIYIALKERNPLRRWATRRFNGLVQRAVKKADLVITIGASPEWGLPRVLVEEFGVAPERLLPVPNGVDLEMFQPRPEATASCGDFGILYVGFVHWYQGVGVLLDAAESLLTEIPNLKLRLVGPTSADGKAWLVERLAGSPLQGSVEAPGLVSAETIPGIIAQSDVCVHPFPAHSDLENVYPVKLFEYLAMGKPVVATNLAAVRAIVQDGFNGLLVKPGDSADMAQAFLRLKRDAGLRATLARQARPSVEGFSWDRINAQVTERLTALETAAESWAGASGD